MKNLEQNILSFQDIKISKIFWMHLHCSLLRVAGGKQGAASKYSFCLPCLRIARIYQKGSFEENRVSLEAEYVMLKI